MLDKFFSHHLVCSQKFSLCVFFLIACSCVPTFRRYQRVVLHINNYSKKKSLFREGFTPIVRSMTRPIWYDLFCFFCKWSPLKKKLNSCFEQNRCQRQCALLSFNLPYSSLFPRRNIQAARTYPASRVLPLPPPPPLLHLHRLCDGRRARRLLLRFLLPIHVLGPAGLLAAGASVVFLSFFFSPFLSACGPYVLFD